ncbi:MAG: single-stranded DNA-binding protein [Thermodesulfobacteriota bacterium]
MVVLNRVILTGRVLKTPQLRYRPDGSAVVHFLLELNDSSGQPKKGLSKKRTMEDQKSILHVLAMEALAEHRMDLLKMGQPLLVVGRLNQRNWKTQEGKVRTQTEIIATDLRAIDENKIDLHWRGEKNEETY